MKKRLLVLLMTMVMGVSVLTACGNAEKSSGRASQERTDNDEDLDDEDIDEEDMDDEEEDGERSAKTDKGYETEDELICDFEDWIAGKISDEEWALGYDPILEVSFRMGFNEIGNGDIADCKRYIDKLQVDDSQMDSYVRESKEKYLDYDLMERIAEKKAEFQSYGMDNFKKFNANYSLYNFISATYTIKDQDVKEVTLYIIDYEDRYYWVAMESK